MRKCSALGWMELIARIVLMILGVLVVTRTDAALTGMVMLYDLIVAIMGIFDIMLYVKTERYIGSVPATALVSDMFSIIAGTILLIYPSAGKWTVALLLPVRFVVHCISRLSHLHMIRITVGSFYYYMTLIVSILGLVLGCIMTIWSGIFLFTVGVSVGGYLILAGIDSTVMAVSSIGHQLVETESAISTP